MTQSRDPFRLLEQLRAIAQTGLEFSKDPYDRERYQQIAALYSDLMGIYLGRPAAEIAAELPDEKGYATPKLDVRGAIFDGDRILLVKEAVDGRWTMPGGFADIGFSAAENTIKEIREESGYEAEVIKLVALWDRDKQGHPPYWHHLYKAFYLCRIVGGAPATSLETQGVEFFPIHSLPPLSLGRTTVRQIERCYAHSLNPSLPTEFE